ncbi:MAG: hypothetical protein K2L81_02720 [Muribaculaceae bacterium]|nr:hypothetical protein [Muribaculaceae bacterium]
MHTLRILFFIGLIATLITGCSDDDKPVVPPEAPTATRTLLIYMASNNSLGREGYDQRDIDEMIRGAKAGFPDNSRVLLFRAAPDKSQTLNEVTSDGLVTLRTYDNTTSAISPERINTVISDSRTLAPADDYALVLWSHANGWLAPPEDKNASQQRSFGDDGGKQISIPDLAATLEPWKFSFIYFDCCYMANIESLYEMRHCANWAIGSAIELPANGMDYSINLPLLLASTPDLIGAAEATFNIYDSKTGMMRTCAMSVVNLNALDDLAQATRQVYQQASSPGADYHPQHITLSSTGSSCFLFDLAHYIDAHSNIDSELLARWHEALNNAVVYHKSTPYLWSTIPLDAHCGLSTFILNTNVSSSTHGYDTLQWWTDVASAKF